MRIWIARGLIAFLLVAGIFPFLHKGRDGTSELPVYTIAGDRMADGAEIYRRSDPKPFTYPPFFAVPFIPFPDIPLDPPRDAAAFVVWYLISIVALMVILVWLHRAFVDHHIARPWLFWLITLVVGGRYVGSVLGNQSHDLLVFLPLALATAALVHDQDRIAGLLAGIAAAFKATPLLFGVLLVLQKRWQAAFAMGITGLAVTLLPDLLLPRADGQLWVLAWLETFVLTLDAGGPADTGPWVAGNILNQSLGGTLHRLLGDSLVIPGLQLGVLAIVALSAYLPVNNSRAAWPHRVAAVLCGMVLLSPMSSKAHFCVLLLPIAACTYQALAHRHRIAIGTLVAAFLLGTITSKDLVGRELGNQLLSWGTVTWITVLLLATMAWFTWEDRKHQSEPG